MSDKQEVKLILASSAQGPTGQSVPLFTLRCRYWRAVHAELLTHREFNRNSGSSRAIPVQKMLDMVVNDTAGPQHWGLNQKGMQAEQENDARVSVPHHLFGSLRQFCTESKELFRNTEFALDGLPNDVGWKFAAWLAAEMSKAFSDAGYHKQIANRITEPYQYMNVVITATNWENFFALRCHPKAMPELRLLAEEIEQLIADSLSNGRVQELRRGEWHVPYIDRLMGEDHLPIADQLKLSTARCASTSYQTVEGLPMTADVAQRVYDGLFSEPPIHASPAEHQAKVGGRNAYSDEFRSPLRAPWLQHRKFIEQGLTPFVGG